MSSSRDVAEPQLHDPAGALPHGAEAVGRPARDEDLFAPLQPPDPVADRDLEPGVEGDPELGPAAVVLEGERGPGPDGDDLEASGLVVGVDAERPPGTALFGDAGAESALDRQNGDFVIALSAGGAGGVVLAREVGRRLGVRRRIRPALRLPARLRSRLPTRVMVWASISVVDRLLPSRSCQLRVRSLPSTRTWRPLSRYFSQNSACGPQTTIRCHSVRSLVSSWSC